MKSSENIKKILKNTREKLKRREVQTCQFSHDSQTSGTVHPGLQVNATKSELMN